MTELITQYQTLIGSILGSFLAILSSIFLWYLKEFADIGKRIRDNEKEIERIFFMATRDSEDALTDLKYYVTDAKKHTEESTTELLLNIPPKFNRIHINEERLTLLKEGLSFVTSQQIDIAVTSAKKFNGYLEQIERMPTLMFDYIIKMLQSGFLTKDEVIEMFNADQLRHLTQTEAMLNKEVITCQRHLFRPVVSLSKKWEKISKNIPTEVLDKMLDTEADLLVVAMKYDLSED